MPRAKIALEDLFALTVFFMNRSRSDLEAEYKALLPKFQLGAEVAQGSLEHLIKREGVDYSMLESRVKNFDSFYEKIDRKSYQNPFEDNEDFIGVRAILYFPEGIDQVCDIIEREFKFLKKENKEHGLAFNQFGYRSTHIIALIPETWCEAPAFRDLGSVKVEFQIRTILMHAWAAVEHQMYKSDSNVPDEIRRRFSRLSAKFEEADEQLQSISYEIKDYHRNIKELTASRDSSGSAPSDVDASLAQKLIDGQFQDRKRSPGQYYIGFVAELDHIGIKSLKSIEDIINDDVLFKKFEKLEQKYPPGSGAYSALGVARGMLDIYSKEYFDMRYGEGGPFHGFNEAKLIRTLHQQYWAERKKT